MKTYTLEEIKDNFFKVKSTKEILEDVKKIGLEGIIWTFYDELRARDVIIQLANDLDKAIEALRFYAFSPSWSEEYQGGPRLSFTNFEGEGFEKAKQTLKELGVE